MVAEKKDIELFMRREAEHVCEQWDTFGAPETMDEALRSIESFAGNEVMTWTDDVAEAYRTDRRTEAESNQIRLGVCILQWLQTGIVNELAVTGALPRDPDAETCPSCGHEADFLSMDVSEAHKGAIYEYCECPECGARFTNVYRLVGQVPDVD